MLEAAKSMRLFGDPLLVVTERRDGERRAIGLVTDHELAGVVAIHSGHGESSASTRGRCTDALRCGSTACG